MAINGPSPENLANGIHGNQKASVVRLTLLGEEVAKWVNERAIPGTRFSWGPFGSGAMVHMADGGRLVFFDRHKHRREVPGVKDAFLPAWSLDGTRLAYLQKTGRKAYAAMWVGVGRR